MYARLSEQCALSCFSASRARPPGRSGGRANWWQKQAHLWNAARQAARNTLQTTARLAGGGGRERRGCKKVRSVCVHSDRVSRWRGGVEFVWHKASASKRGSGGVGSTRGETSTIVAVMQLRSVGKRGEERARRVTALVDVDEAFGGRVPGSTTDAGSVLICSGSGSSRASEGEARAVL